ncbi:GTP-binding protein REM 1-like [Lingula anatina]|uniref:GTP-binding protein REM 1 n=1 Tax=Lingula anatina TaxID=7574 RepID=A0A1S3HYG8_LINAN|nr:GTP-binding protein REM 1 [Lingula anatina]XP_013394838.1 GTP-binding protein REM 1-like [Lingula anatina]|eukprot:XP_013390124.1 GTP-binding protein REM 1 [Lingula anatina]
MPEMAMSLLKIPNAGDNLQRSRSAGNVSDLESRKKPQIQDGDTYVVREFVLSRKGLLGRGDSFKRRSIASTDSMESLNSRKSLDINTNGSAVQATEPTPKRYVYLLGASEVGRSTLVRQFATSRSVCLDSPTTPAPDKILSSPFVMGDDHGASVVVGLDNEETEICFLQPQSNLTTVGAEECINAYIVVYSVTNRSTFRYAKDILHKLRQLYKDSVALILVGNKTDLQRQRTVSTEVGKELAITEHAKFVETSALLKYNVDELLVGTLRQIKLKQAEAEAAAKEQDTNKKKKKGPKSLVRRLFKKKMPSRSKSCENLYML